MAAAADSVKTRGLKVPHYAKAHRPMFSYRAPLSPAAGLRASLASFASSACQMAGVETRL